MDDARMCLSVALTATRHGATVANHVRVTKLLKESNAAGKQVLCGATLKDEVSGKEWDVKAKCIINATGPMTDTIRKMDNPGIKGICAPSSGVHVVLPGYYRYCIILHRFHIEYSSPKNYMQSLNGNNLELIEDAKLKFSQFVSKYYK